jgi:hypothetical protein
MVTEVIVPACIAKGFGGPYLVMAISEEGGTFSNWRVEGSGEVRQLTKFADASPILALPVLLLAVGDGGRWIGAQLDGSTLLRADTDAV